MVVGPIVSIARSTTETRAGWSSVLPSVNSSVAIAVLFRDVGRTSAESIYLYTSCQHNPRPHCWYLSSLVCVGPPRSLFLRDSKLTRLLKDSLGGNCRTVMIANIRCTHAEHAATACVRYQQASACLKLSSQRRAGLPLFIHPGHRKTSYVIVTPETGRIYFKQHTQKSAQFTFRRLQHSRFPNQRRRFVLRRNPQHAQVRQPR